MEHAAPYAAPLACEGCQRVTFVLYVIDGGKLCDSCVEKSERIDRRLATTYSEDPIFCDSCAKRTPFDARVAVVIRECGGGILCDRCKPVVAEGASS